MKDALQGQTTDHFAKKVDEGRSTRPSFLANQSSLQQQAQLGLSQDYFLGRDILDASRGEIPGFLGNHVATVVPVQNEEGTLAGVLDYLVDCYGGRKDNILVVIAPPSPGTEYDRSRDIAAGMGIKTILQADFMETTIRPDEIIKAGIPYPLLQGKGNTVAAGEMLLSLALPCDMPDKILFIHKLDSDITNPAEFDPTRYLAAGAMQDTNNLLQVRAARGGRNNEPIHEAIKLLLIWAGETGRRLYRHLSRQDLRKN